MIKQFFLKVKLWVWPRFEVVFWLVALVALFFINAEEPSFSFCIFRFAGLSSCPGCGLGHSIHHALHARFTASFHEHWLGIPATAIILLRIKQLIFLKKTPQYEA